MKPEDYKKLRDEKEGLDLLYQYFLEEGGKRVDKNTFGMKFQTWCILNGGTVTQAVNQIEPWLDNKHSYKREEENA